MCHLLSEALLACHSLLAPSQTTQVVKAGSEAGQQQSSFIQLPQYKPDRAGKSWFTSFPGEGRMGRCYKRLNRVGWATWAWLMDRWRRCEWAGLLQQEFPCSGRQRT